MVTQLAYWCNDNDTVNQLNHVKPCNSYLAPIVGWQVVRRETKLWLKSINFILEIHLAELAFLCTGPFSHGLWLYLSWISTRRRLQKKTLKLREFLSEISCDRFTFESAHFVICEAIGRQIWRLDRMIQSKGRSNRDQIKRQIQLRDRSITKNRSN